MTPIVSRTNNHQGLPRVRPTLPTTMWSKITTALKPLTSSKEESSSRLSHSEVLNKVYEQHPNLSMFHPNESGQLGRQSVDGHSPSVHNKRNMFKRLSKPALKEDQDSSSLPQQPPTNSKRTNHSLDFQNHSKYIKLLTGFSINSTC